MVAAAKVPLGPVELFFKAVMCNALVCLAVWIGFASRTDKVVGILLPIAAFVACGFALRGEHVLPGPCVERVLAAWGPPGPWRWACGGELVLATLGNVAGGALVGLAYWYAYRGKEAR